MAYDDSRQQVESGGGERMKIGIAVMIVGGIIMASGMYVLFKMFDDWKPLREQVLEKYEGNTNYANQPWSPRYDRLKATLDPNTFYEFRYEWDSIQDTIIQNTAPLGYGLMFGGMALAGLGAFLAAGGIGIGFKTVSGGRV